MAQQTFSSSSTAAASSSSSSLSSPAPRPPFSSALARAFPSLCLPAPPPSTTTPPQAKVGPEHNTAQSYRFIFPGSSAAPHAAPTTTISAAAGVIVPQRRLCTFFDKSSGAHWQGVLSAYAYNALMQHTDSGARLRLTSKTCKVEQLRETIECTVGEALKNGFACASAEEARIQPFLAVENLLAPVTVDFPAAVQESVAAARQPAEPSAPVAQRWKLADYIPGAYTDVD